MASSHSVQEDVPAKFSDIAAALKKCLQYMGPWTISELTMGLNHMRTVHEERDVQDFIRGTVVNDVSVIHDLQRDVRFARAAYQFPDREKIAAEIDLHGGDFTEDDIVYVHAAKAQPFKPSFYIAADRHARRIAVVVRGTSEFSDIVTDVVGTHVAYAGGAAHEGILNSAKWLLANAGLLLLSLMPSYPGWSLFFGGHSLGAGTAAMATHLLHNPDAASNSTRATIEDILSVVPRERIYCVCVACPPVLSRELADSCSGYIAVLTLQHDLVARMSLANVEKLRLEVLQSGWWDHLTSSVRRNEVLMQVAKTLQIVKDEPLEDGTTLADAEKKDRAPTSMHDSMNNSLAQAAEWTASYLKPAPKPPTSPQPPEDGPQPSQPTAKSSGYSSMFSSLKSVAAAGAAAAAGAVATALKDRPAATDAGDRQASPTPAAAAQSGPAIPASSPPRSSSPADQAREPPRSKTSYSSLMLSSLKTAAAAGAAAVASSLNRPAAGAEDGRDAAPASTSSPTRAPPDAAAAVPSGAATAALPAAETQTAIAKASEAIESKIDAMAHLYSPGKLFHVQRRTVMDKTPPRIERQLVIGDPGARFEVIAVRDTLIADHSCVRLLDDLDAILVHITMQQHGGAEQLLA